VRTRAEVALVQQLAEPERRRPSGSGDGGLDLLAGG
jgi:hypothetical protein